LVGETATQLVEKAGKERTAAELAATEAIKAVMPKTAADSNGEVKTPYLLFLGREEIRRFAELVNQHFYKLAARPPAAATEAETPAPRRGRGRAANPAQGPTLPEGFEKAVKGLLDGGKAADLALFGRMLADLPEQNVDAACQVAHAISANKIHSMEMDYYTAVDDLKPNDTAGADMIGTVEFNSACFYRYANLDLGQLRRNLQEDMELIPRTAEAFLRAFVQTIPTGKQNTFAAHNPPSLALAILRDGPPVSLANAFVEPARPDHMGNLILNSVRKLDRYYNTFAPLYGKDDRKVGAMWCEFGDSEIWPEKKERDSLLKGFRKSDWDAVIESVLDAAFPSGGAA